MRKVDRVDTGKENRERKISVRQQGSKEEKSWGASVSRDAGLVALQWA